MAWGLPNANKHARDRASNYPPAEPGALRFEPLKAAVAASHVTLIRLIAIPEHWKQPVLAPLTRTHEPHNIRPVFRVRSLRPIPLSKLASAFAAHDPAQADLLLEMSNCYCHPGRAGGTPITIGEAAPMSHDTGHSSDSPATYGELFPEIVSMTPRDSG